MEIPRIEGCFDPSGTFNLSSIAGPTNAFQAHADGLQIAGLGHVRFSDPSLAARSDAEGVAAALLVGWREYGPAILERLIGDFAIACWDARTRKGLLATDRFATFPVYWGHHAGRLIFSSRPAAVAAGLSRRAELNLDALHAYVYFHMVPAPLSIFSGVERLDIGEALFYESGHVETRRYWTPVFEERAPFEFAVEQRLFLDAVRMGVRDSIQGLNPDAVGCFLSGGTDSSTISGLACEALGEPVRTFSIAFDVANYDESQYSRLAASHFNTRHTEHVLTPDEANATIDTVASSFEQPFGNSSAVPTHLCASIAREAGVTRILGGDGGDELYGGNERYATQWILSHYGKLPGFLRTGVVEPILLGGARSGGNWLLRKGRGYVEQARVPLPERLGSRYNLLNRFGTANVFSDAFLRESGGFSPVELERQAWLRCNAQTQINLLLAFDFKFTLGDNDLPKVTRMCHAAGIDVAFPMLNEAVLAHSLRLRPDQKLRRTDLRHFFRKALRGFLPDAIIDKPKHGFGMPFGDWLMHQPRLSARADDALASLATRGLIRPAFIHELRQSMSSQAAGYFGTMVWVLMSLELWLRQSPLADYRLSKS